MAQHAAQPRYPAAHELPRWVLVGAASGAVSVLVFQQAALALLRPLGFPEAALLWPAVAWGALWGAVLAATLGRFHGRRLIILALLFGALAPTLVMLLAIGPTRGQPPATGVVPLALLATFFLNGAWGLGTGLGLALFGRRPAARRGRR
jgi:hypothetical protein